MESIQEKFTEACNECADALLRYALFKVSDREVAKDLIQETYLRTWNYIAEGHEVENFRAFFYRTLGNLIIDHYRKHKTFSLDQLFEKGYDVPTEVKESLENRLDGEQAFALLEKIGKMYKDVIFLKYVEDLSLKEIAHITGESENAVAVKIHRGIKKMKKIFEEQHG